MRDIRRRLKKAEDRLNLNNEPLTITVTMYGGELPPDYTDGNITIHHVAYEEPTTCEAEGNGLGQCTAEWKDG